MRVAAVEIHPRRFCVGILAMSIRQIEPYEDESWIQDGTKAVFVLRPIHIPHIGFRLALVRLGTPNRPTANASILLFHQLVRFFVEHSLLLSLPLPTLCSTEKNEGGVPIRIGNAALQIQLKRRTP